MWHEGFDNEDGFRVWITNVRTSRGVLAEAWQRVVRDPKIQAGHGKRRELIWEGFRQWLDKTTCLSPSPPSALSEIKDLATTASPKIDTTSEARP